MYNYHNSLYCIWNQETRELESVLSIDFEREKVITISGEYPLKEACICSFLYDKADVPIYENAIVLMDGELCRVLEDSISPYLNRMYVYSEVKNEDFSLRDVAETIEVVGYDENIETAREFMKTKKHG